MVPYLGDFVEDATVYIPFNTFSSDDPAASVTITNLADADIMVHKDGGTTQIVTDGATIAIDFDGITGNHLITIDTSVHADYATGSDYMVRIEGTTVDGATINAWVGQFSIQNRLTSTILTDTEAAVTDTEAIVTDTEAIITDSEAILIDTEAATAVLTDTEAILTDTEASRVDEAAILVDTEAAITARSTLLTDTEAVLADTETGITERATLLVDTEASRVDEAAILSDTEALGAGSGLTALATGTAQSGTASTIVLAAAAAFADNVLNGNVIKIHTGTGAGQSRLILSNTLADDTCNVTPNWTTNPSSDSQYEIVEGAANLTAVGLTAQTSGDIIADTEAVLVDTETGITERATLLVDTEASRVDEAAILVDTEAAITERSTLLTDTEAVLADTETGITERATLLVDTEASRVDEAAILVDTEAITDANEVFYPHGAIHIDTDSGTAGTTVRTHGTPTLPVNTIADAITLATAIGVRSFIVTAGASLTPAQDLGQYVFSGDQGAPWSFGLGTSRAYPGTKVCNALIEPGTATTAPKFEKCRFTTATLKTIDAEDCLFSAGTISITGTSGVVLRNCWGAAWTSSHPKFSFTNVGGDPYLRAVGWRGTLELQNLGTSGTPVIDLHGSGHLEIHSGCTAGTITLRGHWTYTDNVAGGFVAGGGVINLDPIEADTNELQTDWTNGGRLDLIQDAVLVDTEAVLSDTEASQTSETAILADTEASRIDEAAILVDTEAAAAVITDTEAILTDTEASRIDEAAILVDTEAAVTERSTILTDTEAVLVDTEAAATSIAALNDLAGSDVLTQVNAALDTAISELGVAAPTATPTLRTGLMLLYMALRNKTVVQTSGTDALEIHNDAGTKIASKLLTDDGADYTEAEMS